MSRSIKICSRDFKLTFNSNHSGARFACCGIERNGKKKDGRGEIEIGTKQNDLRDCAERVVHEVMEAIFVEDDKRWGHSSESQDCEYLFSFGHDYLCSFDKKVVDGLLTSGFFKLTDGRPKRRK